MGYQQLPSPASRARVTCTTLRRLAGRGPLESCTCGLAAAPTHCELTRLACCDVYHRAGWPDAGCWHGDKEFPDTWCDFGCAVQQLDPNGKFRDSAPDRWTWEGVDLAGCCTAEGFNATRPGCTCTVRHARSAEDCPPAPYYTYR